MIRKEWWKLTFEINKNFEDLIIWKLINLEIFTYAFDYLNKTDNYIDVVIWLPKTNWEISSKEIIEDEFKKLLNKNGFKSPTFLWSCTAEEDWQECWKKYWQPDKIGNNFLVLPSWMKLPKEYNDKKVIKINPGAAFGTGSHPSTSLCLETMENILFKEKKILDIGSGSGILTIAAKILGSNELHALDSDYLAVKSTKENFELNFGDLNDLKSYKGEFHDLKQKYEFRNYDVILCNILADVIARIIPDIHKSLICNGSVILSGILHSQREEIIKVLNFNHFKIDQVISKQGWVCINAVK